MHAGRFLVGPATVRRQTALPRLQSDQPLRGHASTGSGAPTPRYGAVDDLTVNWAAIVLFTPTAAAGVEATVVGVAGLFGPVTEHPGAARAGGVAMVE